MPLQSDRARWLLAFLLALATPARSQFNFDAPLFDWQSNNNALGWSVSQAATTLKTEGGMLFFQANAGLNRLSSPDNLALPTSGHRHLEFNLRNGTAATTATLFFITNEDTAWNGAKSLAFPLTPRDDHNRLYQLDLTTIPGYTTEGYPGGSGGPTHTLRRFRLELTADPGGEGLVHLDRFDVNQDGSRHTWNWNRHGDPLGWSLGGTAANLTVSNGSAAWQSTGNDPYFSSPAGLAFDASAVNTLIVRCRNHSAATAAAIYWSRTDAPGFSESRALTFPLVPADPQVTEYHVDLAASPQWTGTIDRLRVDLPNGSDSAGTACELDAVSLQFSGVMPRPDADSARHFLTLSNAFMFGNLPDYRFQELVNQLGTRRFYTHIGAGDIVGTGSIPAVAAGLQRFRQFGLFHLPIFTVPLAGAQRDLLEATDLREFQWRLDGLSWSGTPNVEDWGGDRNYKRVTYSRLAPLQTTWQKQLAADWTRAFLAQRAAAPERVPVFNLLVESELPSGGGTDDGQLGDYSPFAVAEFRDWLRHAGIYAAATGTFAGEGAPAAIVGAMLEINGAPRSQFFDDPTPADANGTGIPFNQHFGTNFSTWTLRYWDPAAFPDPITDPAFDVSPESGPGFTAGGFDPPRTRNHSNTFWRAWSWDTFDQGGAYAWPPGNPANPAFGFRQQLVRNFGRDLLAVLVANGVPADHVFLHQIPGEFINASRQRSGATPVWTGYTELNGMLGLTRFGTVPNLDAMLQYVDLTSKRNRGWGFFEWHPKPADTAGTLRDTPDYIEDAYHVTFKELTALVPKRMRVLTPGWWDTSGAGFNWNTFPTWNSGMVAAIKAFTLQFPDVPFWHQGPDVPDYTPPPTAGLAALDGATANEQVIVLPARIWPEYHHLWTEWDRFAGFEVQHRSNGGPWSDPQPATNPNQLTFPDRDPAATYEYRVRARSNSDRAGEWSAPLDWAAADLDGDGLPDRREGAGDPDSDGLPNYQDPDSDGDTQPDAAEAARGRDPYSGIFESAFNTDDDFEGWSPKDVAGATVAGGTLTGAVTSNDPWLTRGLQPIPAGSIAHVVIRMRKSGATTGAEYFWATEDGSYSSSRRGEFATTNDGAFHTYFVNPAATPNAANWSGKSISGFRLDPNRADDHSTFAIDFILFSNGDFDADGIPDLTEGATDPDHDDLGAWEDPDADGDGIPDSIEGSSDPDQDGTPNFLDTDSDNDGLPDADEAAQGSDPYSAASPVDARWDPDPATPGTQGGPGTWNTPAPHWRSNITGANHPWPPASSGHDAATFDATAGPVTIAVSGVRTNRLTVLTDAWTFAGAPLTLDGATAELHLAPAATATVTARFDRPAATATDRLTFTGGGTLDLGGGGTLERKWHLRTPCRLSAGTFTSSGATATPASNGMVVFDDATLTISGATLTRTNGDADDALYLGSPAATDEFAGAARTGHLAVAAGVLTVAAGRGIAAGFGGSNNCTLTVSGGTVDAAMLHLGWNGTATATVTGGTLTVNLATATGDAIRHADAGSGTLTITGGLVRAGNVKLATNAAGTTTLTINLDGGTLETERIWLSRGSAATTATHSVTTRCNGGTLRLPATPPDGSTGVLAGDITGSNGTLENRLLVRAGGAVIDTNGRSTAITTPLAEDPASTGGGLTKLGAGTLTLARPGSYTGPTTVAAGTLRVEAPAFHPAATVTIGTAPDSPAVLELPNPGATTVAALFIAGTPRPPGSYGSSNTNGAVTGAGTIEVVPTDDYAAWAYGQAWVYPGTGTGPAADFDRDGLTNQQEYAFASDPARGTPLGTILTGLTAAGTFSYTRRDPALTGLAHFILTSTDLTTWTEDPAAIQSASPPVNGVQTVTVTPGVAPSNGRLFVKVLAR